VIQAIAATAATAATLFFDATNGAVLVDHYFRLQTCATTTSDIHPPDLQYSPKRFRGERCAFRERSPLVHGEQAINPTLSSATQSAYLCQLSPTTISLAHASSLLDTISGHDLAERRTLGSVTWTRVKINLAGGLLCLQPKLIPSCLGVPLH
ncbi:hypothetical protein CLAIMM_10914 isoform 2, partial [Cladophialophora immunda]